MAQSTNTERMNINSLLPETNYVIQVRAVNDAGHSKWSQKFNFTTIDDTINGRKPKTPTSVTWTYDTQGFHATWNAITQNTDNSNAKIIRYGVELTHSGVTKIVRVEPQVTGTTVDYDLPLQRAQALFGVQTIDTIQLRVRAVNSSENQSDWSAPLNATAGLPGPPTSAVVEEITDGVKLSWTAPVSTASLAGYRVYVGTTAGFTPSLANMVYQGTETTYTYNTSTYALHYFKIRSYSVWGGESTDLTASGTPISPFIVDVTPPAVPVITTGSSFLTNNANGVGAYATLVWTQTVPTPDDLSAFDIRWRKVGDTVWSSAGRVDKADRSAIIPVPLAYTSYEFQVRSLDYSTNPSAWSSTATLTGIANVAPGNVAAMSAVSGNDTITYSWTGVSDTDLKNYEVTFSTSPTFASGNITYLTGSSTTLTVGGLSYATNYYARVRAVDAGGLTSSSWSATNTTPTTGSPTTDGQVPAIPSAPTVTPGPAGSLYVTWPAVTTNTLGAASTDAVTYDVHLSVTTGFTPAGGNKVSEVTGTSTLIDTLPGSTTPLTYGTTYYVKLVARDRDGTQATASAQGSGAPSKIVSGDVTSIGADLIVPGTGFIAALVINTGGSIQSGNYNPATPAGWKISQNGAEFLDDGTTVKAEAIKAGTLGGSSGSGVINIAAGTSLIFNGGYLKSNTYTGTTQATNPSGAGFYLGNDGIRIDQGIVSASALTAGTISGVNTIVLSGANAKITGTGWELNGAGLSFASGAISASAINITSAFANSTVAATTSIDGGKITTGTIQSNLTTSVGGTTQPLWVIAMNGAASFADASVRGKLVVGPAGSTDSSSIQSGNYSPGVAGWKIDASGNSFFNSLSAYGNIYTSSGGPRAALETSGGYGGLTVYDSSGAVGWVRASSSFGGLIGMVSVSGGAVLAGTGVSITGTTVSIGTSSGVTVSGGFDVSGGSTMQSLTLSAALGLGGNNINSVGTLTASNIAGSPVFSGNPTWSNTGSVVSGTANVNYNSGQLIRILPSALKYKKNIHPLTDVLSADLVLSLEPKRFKYRNSLYEPDDEFYGFIADDADAEPLLNVFVEYDDGEVETFDYAKFSAAQQLVLREHHARIIDLESEVVDLKGQLNSVLSHLESAKNKS